MTSNNSNNNGIINSRSNTTPVTLIPANKFFTKLNGFATFFGIEYIFTINNIRLENFHSSTISGTQDDEEIVDISRKQYGWEHSILLSNPETTNITLSSDFLSILRKHDGEGGGEQVNDVDVDDEYIHGFKKTIFQSSTVHDCKVDLGLYLQYVEIKKNSGGNDDNNCNVNTSKNKMKHILYPSAPFYNRIIEELNALGWAYLIGVHDSMQRLTLQTLDRAGRKHIFDVMLNSTMRHDGTIALKTILHVDIPTVLNNDRGYLRNAGGKEHKTTTANEKVVIIGNEASSLRELVTLIEKELHRFQTFWDVMDDFDHNVWVLEPQNPSKSSNVRRIAVQENCSMHVKIDPSNPRRMCECDFMGKDSIVEPLRRKLHTNIDRWNYKSTPRENLEVLLSIRFPDPKIAKDVDFRIECGVCYSYRRMSEAGINGGDNNDLVHLPDFICNTCGQAFHQLCVSDWLQSVPSTRRSFNMLFGSCPYCNSPVSVGV